jgi:hypothetical protein
VVLRSFERRLESLVDGVFARTFRSGIRPVELGRRMAREMDTAKTIGVSGAPVAPNQFTIRLAPEDAENFADIRDALVAELCDTARDHARDEGYRFMGPLRVELVPEEGRREGTFQIDARLRQGDGGVGAGSLVLAGGRRIVLGEGTTTIGRLPDCGVQLNDANVSRHHAEIRPAGEGFVIVDLGSTNGTKVNGARVGERPLRDGDQITVGATTLHFDAS